jgi:DNA-directed RNA polymerase beta subunit
MSYSGYDIEDALVMNKASIDRGFGRCIVLKKKVETIKKYVNQTQDYLAPPDKTEVRQAHKIECLGEDGVVNPGEKLVKGNMYHSLPLKKKLFFVYCNFIVNRYLHKFSPKNIQEVLVNPTDLHSSEYRASASFYKQENPSVVDKVWIK